METFLWRFNIKHDVLRSFSCVKTYPPYFHSSDCGMTPLSHVQLPILVTHPSLETRGTYLLENIDIPFLGLKVFQTGLPAPRLSYHHCPTKWLFIALQTKTICPATSQVSVLSKQCHLPGLLPAATFIWQTPTHPSRPCSRDPLLCRLQAGPS